MTVKTANKGGLNYAWFDIDHCSRAAAGRIGAALGIQQELGLRPERRAGAGVVDRVDLVVAWENLELRIRNYELRRTRLWGRVLRVGSPHPDASG